LALCLVIYVAAVIVLLLASMERNQGHLVYALDDAYIHMSMAKNIVLHRVWGVTSHAFTSSSSSPLWTLLLSLVYALFGVNEWAPLALNVLFGALAIAAAYRFLKRHLANDLTAFFALLAILFATPLPSLALAGMEHGLHAWLMLLFAFSSAPLLASDGSPGRSSLTPLLLLAPLLTAARYEGVFVLLVVCALFVLRGRRGESALLGALGFAPLLAYGVWSLSQGWYFLPNSVLLKGISGVVKLHGVLDPTEQVKYPAILLLLSAACLFLVFYRRQGAIWRERPLAVIIFAGATALHLIFAGAGWFYRYEAYLVLLGMLVLAVSTSDFVLQGKTVPLFTAIAGVVFILLAWQLGLRAIASFRDTPQATANIYQQHYQIGRFLRQYYPGQWVALNDIGAATYLADIHLLDLWGLGSMAPARLKLAQRYHADTIAGLAEEMGVTVAIVYDSWYDRYGGVPAQWSKAGQWTILGNIVAGDDTVSIYAVDPAQKDALLRSLQSYSPQLPGEVQQQGVYLNP
jgi:hypothetical protein